MGQTPKVKVTRWKIMVLSQGILMWNIKTLALTVQKLLTCLRSQRAGQNDRQDKNNTPPPPIFDVGGIVRHIYDINGDEVGQRAGSFGLQLKWAKTESIQVNIPSPPIL